MLIDHVLTGLRGGSIIEIKTYKGGASMPNKVGKRYQCLKCGTELIVTRGGEGSVKCCGEPMQLKS